MVTRATGEVNPNNLSRIFWKPRDLLARLQQGRKLFEKCVANATSILGVLPLVFATGATAASRRSLGAAVCGGMITSTVLAVFFTPVFFSIFQSLSEGLTRKSSQTAAKQN